jgi:hypothetical protein
MSSSKRHFTAVIGKKEQGSYVSSSPSSAARKAVSKLCADDKKRKVVFSIRETTQKSNKKVYGPYIGYMQKLDKPVELQGRVTRYKSVAKLDKRDNKMKGGKIIGFGTEGYILQPNMNNSSKPEFVSKLIQIDDTRLEKLKSFQIDLNKIDPSGKYHIPMIIERSRRITSENINRSNLVEQEKHKLKSFNPNYKITYEFGGISVWDFALFNKYDEIIDVTKDFCKNMLRGIVNIFKGLYEFYKNGINHLDLHGGNVVFLIDNPKIMRMIDNQFFNIVFNNNNNLNRFVKIQFKDDLQNLVSMIEQILNKFKPKFQDDPEFIEKLSQFLNIPELQQYIQSKAQDFGEEIFERIKAAMKTRIKAM